MTCTPPPRCAFERCQAGGVILERAPRVVVATFVFHPGCAAAVRGWLDARLVDVPSPAPVDGRATIYRRRHAASPFGRSPPDLAAKGDDITDDTSAIKDGRTTMYQRYRTSDWWADYT